MKQHHPRLQKIIGEVNDQVIFFFWYPAPVKFRRRIQYSGITCLSPLSAQKGVLSKRSDGTLLLFNLPHSRYIDPEVFVHSGSCVFPSNNGPVAGFRITCLWAAFLCSVQCSFKANFIRQQSFFSGRSKAVQVIRKAKGVAVRIPDQMVGSPAACSRSTTS